ncbi:hypothetical protein [Sinorhizobium medicae]
MTTGAGAPGRTRVDRRIHGGTQARVGGVDGILHSFTGQSLNTAYSARLFSPPGWAVAYVLAIELTVFRWRWSGSSGKTA